MTAAGDKQKRKKKRARAAAAASAAAARKKRAVADAQLLHEIQGLGCCVAPMVAAAFLLLAQLLYHSSLP